MVIFNSKLLVYQAGYVSTSFFVSQIFHHRLTEAHQCRQRREVAELVVGEREHLGMRWESRSKEWEPYGGNIVFLTGWWYTYPSEKYEFVSWDDSSQYIEKYKMFQTTNQIYNL